MEKQIATQSSVSHLLTENGIKNQLEGENKILVEINHVKFSLSCSRNNVVWSLKVPFTFWFVIAVVFAFIIFIITTITEGSPYFVILGALPSYLLYRYKPSTLRAKAKLIGFLNDNFK
jgi:hypothetical protein